MQRELFDSLLPEELALQERILNKLMAVTSKIQSPLYEHVWKIRKTKHGQIPALRAKAKKAYANGSTGALGWPTPQASDVTGGGQAKRADGRANLVDFAMLAGWRTPNTVDGKLGSRNGQIQLCHEVLLARWPLPSTADGGPLMLGWNTPRATDGSNGGPNQAGGALPADVALAGWPTPMAGTPAQNGNNEAGNTDSSRQTVAMCQWPAAFGPGPIGFLLGPNGWETVRAFGQCRAEFSLWLMGYPAEFWACAVRATQSIRTKRRRGSRRVPKSGGAE